MHSYLMNNPIGREAQNKFLDPRMDILEQIDRDSLWARFEELVQERDQLLPEAKRLDEKDVSRLRENQAINEEKEQINAFVENYDAAVGRHNEVCNPAPDDATYQWCLSDFQRLQDKRGEIARRTAGIERRIEKYNEELRDFLAWWKRFDALVRAWEERVRALIARLENLLRNATGDCTEEQHRALQERVNSACKSQSWKCRRDQSCEILRENLQRGLSCYEARKEIMDECFQGGDENHKKALRETQLGIDNCRGIIQEICGGVGVAAL